MGTQTPDAFCAPENGSWALCEADTVTVNEVASRLHVHPRTVYRQLAEGYFPCVATKIGRQWRISRASVDAFLREVQQ